MEAAASDSMDVETSEKPSKRQKIHFDPAEYKLRKRLPPGLPRRPNDVYITRKTDFKGQLERCKKLLDQGEEEVFLHGLGAAVHRAIHIALTLQSTYLNMVDVCVNTSTVEVTDDFEPEKDALEFASQSRNVSAVHIRVYKLPIKP